MSNKNKFLSDRPVGRDKAYDLFDEDTQHQIQEIAQHLINPLHEDNDGKQFDSMAFAIYGDWGAGKSSFLECVKEQSLAFLEQNTDTYLSGKERIKFCYYNASIYSHAQANVRTTLTMEVLNELSGRNAITLEKLFLEDPQKDKFVPTSVASKVTSYSNIQLLCDDLGSLAYLPLMLSGEITNIDPRTGEKDARKMRDDGKTFPDGDPGVLVIFVDDLDRCTKETVAEVLRVVYHWSSVKNLFFLLAVNQALLLDAVQQIVPSSAQVNALPDYALEKYIQHHHELPSLNDEERLRKFIDSLVDEFDDDDFRNAFSNHKKLYELLQKGLNRKTPRALKKCLNFVRPDSSYEYTKLEKTINPQENKNIQEKSSAQNTQAEQAEALQPNVPKNQDPTLSRELLAQEFLKHFKEKILEHNWPEIYKLYYFPAVKKTRIGAAKLRIAWQELEHAAQEYMQSNQDSRQSPDDELLHQRLNVAAHYYPDSENFLKLLLDDEERKLINFLACPPFFVKPASEELSQRSRGLGTKSSLRNPSVLLNTRNIETDFQRLYDASRAAATDDPPRIDEALEYSLQAAVLVEDNIDRIPSTNADGIGNLAFQVERFHANDLADLLFSLALQLDPSHANNLRGYISFIADTERRDRYDNAIGYLKKLEIDQPAFRPTLRVALKAQLGELLADNKKRELEITEEDLQLLYTQVEESAAEYGSAMLAARKMKRYDVMLNLLHISLKQAETVSEGYKRIRILADYLTDTQKNHPEAVSECLEVYRRLINHPSWIDEEDLADIHHNYAIELYRKDIDDEAGRMWYKAYQLNPRDTNIQRAYANYLTRAGKPHLVKQVNNSEPVTESVENTLQPHNQDFPGSSAEYIEQIFERLAKLDSEGE